LLAAKRVVMDEFVPCSVCSRTPLIGEEVTVLGRGGGESPVCSLCLERPRTETLGEPLRRERMRTAAGAANVRLSSPAPAPSIERRRATPVS
jgi:hypothetical protein